MPQHDVGRFDYIGCNDGLFADLAETYEVLNSEGRLRLKLSPADAA